MSRTRITLIEQETIDSIRLIVSYLAEYDADYVRHMEDDGESTDHVMHHAYNVLQFADEADEKAPVTWTHIALVVVFLVVCLFLPEIRTFYL